MEADDCYKFSTIRNYIARAKQKPIEIILDVGANVGDITLRIPMKSDTDSDNCRTPIPAQIGQLSERSDAWVLIMQKCPK